MRETVEEWVETRERCMHTKIAAPFLARENGFTTSTTSSLRLFSLRLVKPAKGEQGDKTFQPVSKNRASKRPTTTVPL